MSSPYFSQLKEICSDFFTQRGYSVDEDKAIHSEIPWRPNITAKRNGEVIVVDIRITDRLPNFMVDILRQVKTLMPNVKAYFAIPLNKVISQQYFTKSSIHGSGIYAINGNLLREIVPCDVVLCSQTQREYYIEPGRDYSNLLAIRNILRLGSGYIKWLDKHFRRKALEWIMGEIEEGTLQNVTDIRILAGHFDNVTRRLQNDFRLFATECQTRGKQAEFRVITQRSILGSIHDRYILSQNVSFNVLPVQSIELGQWGSLFQTRRPPPFDRYWQGATNLLSMRL